MTKIRKVGGYTTVRTKVTKDTVTVTIMFPDQETLVYVLPLGTTSTRVDLPDGKIAEAVKDETTVEEEPVNDKD